MTAVAASHFSNNAVACMKTQPPAQLYLLTSASNGQQQGGGGGGSVSRPTYSPSNRDSPRARKSSGAASSCGQGSFSRGAGEKSNAVTRGT